jgi:hypothetical protein
MRDDDDADMTLPLTQDEALVLFEWLANFNKREHEFDDQAEQRVLWDLEAMLESELVEPFSPNYRDLVAAARKRVRDSTD